MEEKDMNTVTEAELKDFVQNGAVKSLHIKRVASGSYQLTVNLNWKKGDFHLVTSRKTVREWVSLDRLANHINKTYQITPATIISLSLNKEI